MHCTAGAGWSAAAGGGRSAKHVCWVSMANRAPLQRRWRNSEQTVGIQSRNLALRVLEARPDRSKQDKAQSATLAYAADSEFGEGEGTVHGGIKLFQDALVTEIDGHQVPGTQKRGGHSGQRLELGDGGRG